MRFTTRQAAPAQGRIIRSAPEWWHEVVVLGAAVAVYFGVRVLVEGSAATATRNAERLIEFESTLGIDVESDLQGFAVDNEVVRIVGNVSYVWLHWPLLIAVVLYLYIHHDGLYHRLRTALMASGAMGLVLFWLLPMAPPRFMPGFVGTVSDEARRHYLTYPLSWTNQYAAFPSFHVGWTLVACLALAAAMRSRTSTTLALIPAVLVGVAVVTTGNHYIIDSVVGALLALAAYQWAAGRGRPDGGPPTTVAPAGDAAPTIGALR